jgi:hypothetical protein
MLLEQQEALAQGLLRQSLQQQQQQQAASTGQRSACPLPCHLCPLLLLCPPPPPSFLLQQLAPAVRASLAARGPERWTLC